MMSAMPDWDPSHQTGRRSRVSPRWLVWVFVVLAVLGVANGATKHQSPEEIVAGIVVLSIIASFGLPAGVRRRLYGPLRRRGREPELAADPLETVRDSAARSGGGVYLGGASHGKLRF